MTNTEHRPGSGEGIAGEVNSGKFSSEGFGEVRLDKWDEYWTESGVPKERWEDADRLSRTVFVLTKSAIEYGFDDLGTLSRALATTLVEQGWNDDGFEGTKLNPPAGARE